MKYFVFSVVVAMFMLAACGGNEEKQIQKEINEGEEEMHEDTTYKQRVRESEDFFSDTTINYDSIVNDPNRKKY